MKRLLLLSLLLVGCTHATSPKRDPAVAKSECEIARERSIAEVSFLPARSREMSMFQAIEQDTRRDLMVRAQVALDLGTSSCLVRHLAREVRALQSAATDLVHISQVVGESSRGILESEPLIGDSGFASKSLCVVRCLDDNTSPDCAKACGTTEDFITFVYTSGVLLPFLRWCPREEEVQYLIPALLSTARISDRNASNLGVRLNALADELGKLAVRLEQKAPARKCEMPLPSWYSRARKAVVRLAEVGSGFYVETPVGPRLVSAHHVVFDKSRVEGRLEDRTVRLARRAPRGGREYHITKVFQVKPGEYNASYDLVQSAGNSRFPPLKGVPVGALPRKGQTFFIAGNPGSGSENFTLHRCQYLGIVRSISQEQGSERYLLRCPLVSDWLSGASGGAMIDIHGHVWGAITEHLRFGGYVTASPIAVAADGLKLGFQERFESDECLKDDLSGYRKCVIIPGLSEMN